MEAMKVCNIPVMLGSHLLKPFFTVLQIEILSSIHHCDLNKILKDIIIHEPAHFNRLQSLKVHKLPVGAPAFVNAKPGQNAQNTSQSIRFCTSKSAETLASQDGQSEGEKQRDSNTKTTTATEE